MNGDIAPISALASGVAAPNRAAAASATKIAECLGFTVRGELRLMKLGVALGRGGLALPFERLAVSCSACLRPDAPIVIIARRFVAVGRRDRAHVDRRFPLHHFGK